MQLTLKADSRPAAAVVLRESENRGMNRLTLLIRHDIGESQSRSFQTFSHGHDPQEPETLKQGSQAAPIETRISKGALPGWHWCRCDVLSWRDWDTGIDEAHADALRIIMKVYVSLGDDIMVQLSSILTPRTAVIKAVIRRVHASPT